MSLTNDQLETRVIAIEEKLNEIQAAILNLVTRRTMIAYTSVRQNEVTDLQTRVSALESAIQVLQDAL